MTIQGIHLAGKLTDPRINSHFGIPLPTGSPATFVEFDEERIAGQRDECLAILGNPDVEVEERLWARIRLRRMQQDWPEEIRLQEISMAIGRGQRGIHDDREERLRLQTELDGHKKAVANLLAARGLER